MENGKNYTETPYIIIDIPEDVFPPDCCLTDKEINQIVLDFVSD